jgi:hypothetical protein
MECECRPMLPSYKPEKRLTKSGMMGPVKGTHEHKAQGQDYKKSDIGGDREANPYNSPNHTYTSAERLLTRRP